MFYHADLLFRNLSTCPERGRQTAVALNTRSIPDITPIAPTYTLRVPTDFATLLELTDFATCLIVFIQTVIIIFVIIINLE